MDSIIREDQLYTVDRNGRLESAKGPTDTDTPPQNPSQGAINEETGEINWDCPCLASALAPPCGEFFKAAFSCFVASQSEPKGSDCLEKFSAMQECFRAHPDVYMKEGQEDEEDDLTVDLRD